VQILYIRHLKTKYLNHLEKLQKRRVIKMEEAKEMEIQTTVNEDGLKELLEGSEIENVYEENK